MGYSEFLAGKDPSVRAVGFDPPTLNPTLKDFQRTLVTWACRLGRAAFFADCGMGKTFCQLEWARLVHEHTGRDVLILAPLAVTGQTVREGERFGIPVRYAKTGADVLPGITVTNYDRLAAFDVSRFAGIVLDESSILKAFDGKTRALIIETFNATMFRLACTATPAPNDHMELGNHAEFLGVMTRQEMLATFFVHDGGDTQSWRLKGHAETDFWRWVCSWAVMVRKPSDLEFPDTGYILPPMRMHEHVVPVDHIGARKAGMLFAMEAKTLSEQREAKRGSIDARVAECARIVNAEPGEPWTVWCELNDEGDALTRAIDGAVQIAGADTNDVKERRMLDFTAGKIRVVVSKASICGHGMNWQHSARVAFVGVSHSFEQTYQAIRRSWRFGQSRPVDVHFISSELEGAVVANLRRKEADASRMAESMLEHMRDVQREHLRGSVRTFVPYHPSVEMQIPEWAFTSPE